MNADRAPSLRNPTVESSTVIPWRTSDSWIPSFSATSAWPGSLGSNRTRRTTWPPSPLNDVIAMYGAAWIATSSITTLSLLTI